jgi:thioredoxin-like negative regulator of GroEL
MSIARVLPWLIAVAVVLATSGCDLDGSNVTPETARGTIHVYVSKRCSACRMAAPIIEKLKREGYPIRVIDVNKKPRKAGEARVHMIPTFIHYLNGKETHRIVGTASESELKRMLL